MTYPGPNLIQRPEDSTDTALDDSLNDASDESSERGLQNAGLRAIPLFADQRVIRGRPMRRNPYDRRGGSQ